MSSVRRPLGAKRSLTHVGGAIDISGDADLAAPLRHALEVESSVGEGDGPSEGERAARAHVHGFHTYPARLHPDTASRLVLGLSQPRQVVLDPFCGSGTVVIEAALAGRRAAGSDVNPLAVALARRKARPSTPEERAALVQAARDAAGVADARRKAKSGPSRRYPPADVEMYDPHVLLELDGLRLGIEQTADPHRRSDLFLVLSAILVKVSRRTSDTSGPREKRRIAAGYPSKLLVKKTEDLTQRLEVVAERLARAPRAKIFVDDARVLSHVPDEAVDLIVTSPPYPGVYDYLEHHEARLRWLGLSSASMERGEVGSRRSLRHRGADEGLRSWTADLDRVFDAFARVVRARARVVLIMADAVIGRRGVFCEDLIPEVARHRGFEVAAVASQKRPHFHEPSKDAFAHRPRREHAILLVRSPSRARVWQDTADARDARGRRRS